MQKERVRKKRSDAKKTVKPTIEIGIKETIYRMSDIINVPVKDIAEALIIHGINSDHIINQLSNYFKRDIRFNNSLYFGSHSNPSIVRRMTPGSCERITTRLSQSVIDIIAALNYALDCTEARACSCLIESSMRDFTFINEYIKSHLEKNLDKHRLKELEKMLDFVNEESEVESTFATLLAHIIDEVKEPLLNMKEAVDRFIIHNWKDK